MKFYYIDDVTKQQFGPFYINELHSKNIRPETMVWCSGMENWDQAKDVPELAFLFDKSLPTPKPISQTTPPVSNSTNHKEEEEKNWNDVLPMPKTWLVESILVTIFCCLPMGIAGIVFASKVESAYKMGDYEGAVSASKKAKQWTIASFLSLFIIYFLIFVVAILSEI